MNLVEYISQPTTDGEIGQALHDLLDVEVFFKRPLEGADDSDRPVTARDAVNWPLEAKRLGETVALVFYTSRTHPRIVNDSENACAALPLRECLQLSFDFPGADAIALVNQDMSWKAFLKENIEKILGTQQGGGFR